MSVVYIRTILHFHLFVYGRFKFKTTWLLETSLNGHVSAESESVGFFDLPLGQCCCVAPGYAQHSDSWCRWQRVKRPLRKCSQNTMKGVITAYAFYLFGDLEVCHKKISSRLLFEIWTYLIWFFSDLTWPHPKRERFGREFPLLQGNLGWWNIILWPDKCKIDMYIDLSLLKLAW